MMPAREQASLFSSRPRVRAPKNQKTTETLSPADLQRQISAHFPR
jgi:hypothetical protein